jgi:hypothetical protein
MRFCQRHFVGALLSAIFYRRNFALRYFVGQPVLKPIAHLTMKFQHNVRIEFIVLSVSRFAENRTMQKNSSADHTLYWLILTELSLY